jgi:hypothetical protein
MRSSFMIFLLGLVLGSTLGIGGIWTQVVQPAGEQIQQLEAEHGIMQTALDEAGKALKEVAANLREDGSRPEPINPADIFPSSEGSSIIPSGITPGETAGETMKLGTSDRKEIAERLDNLALKLEAARAGKAFER